MCPIIVKTMDAEIIAIGSELLLGMVDTNSAYLARQLATSGINLLRTHVVGDQVALIAATVNEALSRATLVICTGGLGPTLDDVTREAVAQAVGQPLEFRQALLDQIATRFAAMQRPMNETNHRQAYVPQGARAIENPRGTAPGFIAEKGTGIVVVLPGVPHEMRFLFENAVLPYLRSEHKLRGVILVRTLYVSGLGESLIGERIADLMRGTNPRVGTSAKQGVCQLRIDVRAETTEEAEALLVPVEAMLRERLGEFLIGQLPLDQLVARLLGIQHQSLALYEGNLEAPVYHTLNASAEGLACLRGLLLNPLPQPVDEPTAANLALQGALKAREQWQTDLALGIQAVPQPNGFSAVNIALVSPSGNAQLTRSFDLRPPEGWEYVGTLALETLRRQLLGYPLNP